MWQSILLLFIITTLNVFSQTIKYFNAPIETNWTQWEKRKVTPEFLRQNFTSITDIPYEDADALVSACSSYHWLDIDNDNKEELIYSGVSWAEGEMAIIYRVTDSKIQKIQHFFGRILDIQNLGTNHSKMIVLDFACCAGYTDYVHTYEYNSTTRNFEITNSLSKVRLTIIPSNLQEPVKFKTKDSKCFLRYSPEIITGMKEDENDFEPINGENILTVYNSGATGQIFAEAKDNSGTIWYLVVMDSISTGEKTIIHSGSIEFLKYQPVGWIAKKSVSVITN